MFLIVKNPYTTGRKTAYKAEYCDGLVSHMAQGYSYETFSAMIGVTRKTLYNWEEKHKEWVKAKEKGMELCQFFWEQLGTMGTMGIKVENANKQVYDYSKVNPTLWIFNMKNRFHWKDRMDMTTDDAKIESTVVILPSNNREKENN